MINIMGEGVESESCEDVNIMKQKDNLGQQWIFDLWFWCV